MADGFPVTGLAAGLAGGVEAFRQALAEGRKMQMAGEEREEDLLAKILTARLAPVGKTLEEEKELIEFKAKMGIEEETTKEKGRKVRQARLFSKQLLDQSLKDISSLRAAIAKGDLDKARTMATLMTGNLGALTTMGLESAPIARRGIVDVLRFIEESQRKTAMGPVEDQIEALNRMYQSLYQQRQTLLDFLLEEALIPGTTSPLPEAITP